MITRVHSKKNAKNKPTGVRARNCLQGHSRLQTSVIFFLSLPVAQLILARFIAALNFMRWVFFLCLHSKHVSQLFDQLLLTLERSVVYSDDVRPFHLRARLWGLRPSSRWFLVAEICVCWNETEKTFEMQVILTCSTHCDACFPHIVTDRFHTWAQPSKKTKKRNSFAFMTNIVMSWQCEKWAEIPWNSLWETHLDLWQEND